MHATYMHSLDKNQLLSASQSYKGCRIAHRRAMRCRATAQVTSIKVGSRGSKLARLQAEQARGLDRCCLWLWTHLRRQWTKPHACPAGPAAAAQGPAWVDSRDLQDSLIHHTRWPANRGTAKGTRTGRFHG